jgi:hypothetical protein
MRALPSRSVGPAAAYQRRSSNHRRIPGMVGRGTAGIGAPGKTNHLPAPGRHPMAQSACPFIAPVVAVRRAGHRCSERAAGGPTGTPRRWCRR